MQVDRVRVHELEKMLQEESPPVVADVRAPKHYAAGHIPGALRICGAQDAAAEVSAEQRIVAYCDMRRPSKVRQQYMSEAWALAAAKLGCEVVILEGGFPAWKNAGLPVAENLGWLERWGVPLPKEARLRAGRTAPLEDWFHNVGTSDDRTPWAADLDGYGRSLSAQALGAAGATPGSTLLLDGIAFRWPQGGPGWPDNVVAAGQSLQLPVRPGAARIGILGLSTQASPRPGAIPSGFPGSSTPGSCTGRGEIRYADGSTEPFALCLPDWVIGEREGLPPGLRVAVRMPRWNARRGGAPDVTTTVFAAIVPLRSDKTPVTLTLPERTDSQTEQHIFAVALGGAER